MFNRIKTCLAWQGEQYILCAGLDLAKKPDLAVLVM
jgi:hypothetical protein